MKEKRIVIISKMFFPEMAPRALRTTELAKELSKQGFNVSVYVPLKTFDIKKYESQHNLTLKDINPLKFANRINTPKPKVLRGLDYLLNRVIEYPDIELFLKPLEILKKEKNIHTVITIGMPHSIHWGTAWAKNKLKQNFPKKWIADCGDPYMGNFFHTPFFYFKYLEKYFCKHVDFITIPIKEAKEAYYKEYHSKIKVIPQGFNFEDIIIKTKKKKNSIPHFCYAGSIYIKHRNPSVFLDYLTTIKTDFRFIVYTSSVSFFNAYKEKLGKKLIIREFILRLDLLDVLQEMDFVVNFENGTSVQLPSKLIDYTIIKVPVLSINCIKFDPQYTNEFLNNDYSNKLIVGNAEQYNIKNVVNKFVNLINK